MSFATLAGKSKIIVRDVEGLERQREVFVLYKRVNWAEVENKE